MIVSFKRVSLMVLLFTATASLTQAANEYPPQAKESADKWLTIVDQGQYDQSWKDAAELFRNGVTQETWKKSVGGVRSPLGKVLARKMISGKALSSVPGGPDGSYVVFQFQTSFQNKKNAIETVTPMLDKDGKWHVSGYYIR